MPRPRRPLEHGTTTGYNTHGCRCDQCRAANAAYSRSLAARKRAGEPVRECSRAPITHGTTRGYNRGCRCDDCRAARRRYIAEWKLRTGRSKTSRLLTAPDTRPRTLTVAEVLEARERTLSRLIATSPRSVAGREAVVRRAEVRALLRNLTGATA